MMKSVVGLLCMLGLAAASPQFGFLSNLFGGGRGNRGNGGRRPSGGGGGRGGCGGGQEAN